jgi:hypothetical protein
MSMPQLIPNLMTGNTGGAAQGLQAMGMPPVGNSSGSQLPGPTGVNAMAAAPGALPTATAPTLTGGPAPAIPGTVNPVGATPPVAGVPIVNQGVGGAIPVSQQQASQQQLTNVFGAGVGGDISDTINNLGSNDSTYMQAYTAAMAQPNAENLATLNTTLANSGVSANSSTAAIANADFQTGVTANR